ncbi:coiled-coil domain-containing protein 106-like [Cyprinodon tularosa]|uniref:coiled-coil domain-containing protein 106-like n=1 Tax=Cyprinodon tularosa TaxID=77115 RepID=UPI0018E1DA74|nr:coiled-coil domain-containing protein 106-like [Cyprinodon tularosa]
MEGVATTSTPQRRVQTRAGHRKNNGDKRGCCDLENDSSGAPQMAPTAKLQKHTHELELAKMKIACQEEMIKQLTKERDFLKDHLARTSRNMNNDDPSPEAFASHADCSGSSNSSSDSFSTDPSSDSSSSSTSDDRKKRKKKGKKGTRERRNKRSSIARARGPDEVIARYRKVLKAYKRKKSITAACKIVGVDRNTIALNAQIAELSIAAPEKFAEFKEQHTRKHKLGDFAGKCVDAIRDDADIDSRVKALKKSGKLLPVGKGDF